MFTPQLIMVHWLTHINTPGYRSGFLGLINGQDDEAEDKNQGKLCTGDGE